VASFLKRTLQSIGLAYEDEEEDDEYEAYDAYPDEEPEDRPRLRPRSLSYREPAESQRERTPRERQVSPEPQIQLKERARAQNREIDRSALVKPISPDRNAKPYVIAPAKFGDAQVIADRIKLNQPVIVNLQVVGKDLSRRMIDFCSGVAYALSGTMEKVADQVFLISPSNVEVSQEERLRLQRRGFSG
jgi:cell division inhibitor SepF